MDSDFCREQALRARDLAEKADQFTRKRLLALADRYDAKASGPSRVSRMIKRADAASPRVARTDPRTVGRGMKKPKPKGTLTEIECNAWAEGDTLHCSKGSRAGSQDLSGASRRAAARDGWRSRPSLPSGPT